MLTYSTKPYGFNQAIRTLNPDFIATDELSNDEDAFGVLRAILGGVKVIATTHASNIREIKENSFLKYLLKLKAFKNYIQIDNETGIRNITIFDENLSKICSF